MGNDDKELSLDIDNTDQELEEMLHKNLEKVFNDINISADLLDGKDKIEDEGIEDEGIEDEGIEDEGIEDEGIEDEDIEDEDIKDEDIKDEYLDEYVDLDQGEEEDRDEFIIDNEIMDINASLAKQISEVLDETAVTKTSFKFKNLPRWAKIQIGVITSLLCVLGLGLFLVFSKPGNKILMNMGIGIGGHIWDTMTKDFDNSDKLPTDLDNEVVDKGEENNQDEEVETPDPNIRGRKEDYAYNILLLGEEAIGSGSGRGRTDLIIIATLNTKEKSVKLTSILRDTLVQIPGYLDNKINSAYEKGGIDLLYETIERNFDIHLDGSVMVNFESFEEIIDMLGGIEIELTSGEAKYLNTTNYISKKQYRNVKPGKQVLNGNQVLGYSRIRRRATITGANNDYGRTDRHRIILNAIFEKYKSKSMGELASIMIKVIPKLTTDIDHSEFSNLLSIFMDMGVSKIDQLRIPADGTFTDNIEVRGMDVLIPDMEKNIEILHKHIFGE
ncbi:MAG: hypothetical protein GX288_02580 [Clostridiales bacterium]|nr:hypothetical protein [Clostridiales bacterium]